ncbi:MAG TPA: RDD family protein [Candidatus Elarobacter sp.]|jgi:uncharacterized RDD family membrane protein YckC
MDPGSPHYDDPTIAMHAVEPPPPRIDVPPPARPGTYQAGPVEEAVVVGPAPPRAVKPAGPRFPVGNPLGYAFARLFASALDVGLVAWLVGTLAYALIAINPITGLPTNSQRGFDATLAMGAVLAMVYVIVAEAIFGTTIGKLVFNLHVYAVRDRSVGFARAFVRALFRPLDLLAIGGLLAMLPGHRRLGDLASGTIVTRQSPLGGFAPYVGLLLALIVAGVPFVLVGTTRTLAGFWAFVQFAPGIGARIALLGQHLIGAIPH